MLREAMLGISNPKSRIGNALDILGLYAHAAALIEPYVVQQVTQKTARFCTLNDAHRQVVITEAKRRLLKRDRGIPRELYEMNLIFNDKFVNVDTPEAGLPSEIEVRPDVWHIGRPKRAVHNDVKACSDTPPEVRVEICRFVINGATWIIRVSPEKAEWFHGLRPRERDMYIKDKRKTCVVLDEQMTPVREQPHDYRYDYASQQAHQRELPWGLSGDSGSSHQHTEVQHFVIDTHSAAWQDTGLSATIQQLAELPMAILGDPGEAVIRGL